MSEIIKAYVGVPIHDGYTLCEQHALGVDGAGYFRAIPLEKLRQDCTREVLRGGMITPGFVDLQVNGGGGVMFNDDQSVAALRTIAQAHQKTGTAAILPTLITDNFERTTAAIKAVEHAISEQVDGIIGIHLEGPHLSKARKGAHDPSLIRPMTDEDLALMLDAAARLPNVMVTVAPENVTNAQIKTMAEAGIVVSLGHTDAPAAQCHAAFDAGARCVTHLFNAMSQLGSREPGLVGATLERAEIFAGLIADGIHVAPATMRIALAAKPHSNRIFLISDAMATTGAQINSFELNGRTIFRQDGRLTLADGTLAGADLTMTRAIDVMHRQVGETRLMALPRATSTPASLLRAPSGYGRLDQPAKNALYFEDGAQMPIVLSAH